jgi:hypothetical protein
VKSVIIFRDGRRVNLASAVSPELYAELDNGRHLRELPPPRSVKAVGVWTARAERSWRGGWTPELEPVTVLLDDAIVRMAAKTIRPVMTDSYVRLMTAEGIALLEELGSTSLAATRLLRLLAEQDDDTAAERTAP